MGFVQPTTIQHLAESLAIPRLTHDAAKALAPHIDVRLREIIQEACKFARHGKRNTLTTEDVNSALRLRNCEPLYGFGGKDPARFIRAAGHPDLFYVEDLELATDKVIEKPLPSVPCEVGVVPHWLAIEGVQPRISENEPIERPRAKRPRVESTPQKNSRRKLESDLASQPAQGMQDAVGSDPQAAVVLPPVRLVLSVELLRLFENLKQVISDAKALPDGAPGGAFWGWPSVEAGKGAPDLPADVSQRLEREQRALQCLAFDPGQHPLAPATIELITEQVQSCMRHLPQIQLLIQVARSLLRNREIKLERYLEKLISPVMTCIVTKRLGAAPCEDHWSVRAAAADVIAEMCATYGDRFPNIPHRIVKQFVKALKERSKSLPCHYGAVVGLTKLGRRIVRNSLLPNAQPYLSHLGQALDPGNPNEVQRMEAGQVYGALSHACASSLISGLADRPSKDYFACLGPGTQPRATAKLDFASKQHSQGKHHREAAANGKKKQAAAELKKQGSQRTLGSGRAGSKPEAKSLLANGAPARPAVEACSSQGELAGSETRQSNTLEDAWREDSSLGKHLTAVHEMFGDAIQPYIPAMPISQVFL